MKKKLFLSLSIVALFSVAALSQAASAAKQPPAFGDPLPGLSASQTARFITGNVAFSRTVTVADGLGPVFNGRSCAGCHRAPVTGGGGNRLVTRFGTISGGIFDPLATLGGSLAQDRAIGPADGSAHQFTPETPPAAATIVAQRRTQPLFGLGLVDAVPDQTFVDLASREARRHDGTAGHMNMVTDVSTNKLRVGKFGWKSQVPSLRVFSGDGLLNEMGITNPLFPNENCPNGVCSELAFNPRPDLNDDGTQLQAIADYMVLLGGPPRGPATPGTRAGEAIFKRIGCTACHVATLHTGENSIAALDQVTFHPYSDFLLHDIGTGDGIVQEQAAGNEIRTAPLWGLRMVTLYLHDGRASTLDGAILAHGGQAASARSGYLSLSGANKARLIDFLNSL